MNEYTDNKSMLKFTSSWQTDNHAYMRACVNLHYIIHTGHDNLLTPVFANFSPFYKAKKKYVYNDACKKSPSHKGKP